jgi:ATP-dependent Lon protease
MRGIRNNAMRRKRREKFMVEQLSVIKDELGMLRKTLRALFKAVEKVIKNLEELEVPWG